MKPNTEQLAREFSAILRTWLTPEQMDLVIARNRVEPHPEVCHSHDFCDANMALFEVFQRHGMNPLEDEADCLIWNKVWDLAKANAFAFPPNHMEDLPATQEEYDRAHGLDFSGQTGASQVLADEIGNADPTDAETADSNTRYLNEFPDFGPLPFVLPELWEDTSWHNDGCPSFECGPFRVCIDYADPDQREDADSMRFVLTLKRTEQDSEDYSLIVTDDEIVILTAVLLITLREQVCDWQKALGGEREGLDELCAQIDGLLTKKTN